MSYTIEDSKFVIFGNGYDGVRNNSGEGLNEPMIHPLSTPTHGAVDLSGEYVYLTDGMRKVRKFRIDPWEEISVTLPKGCIYHPTNTENNIGLIWQTETNQITVFDLGTGEVTKTIATSGSFLYTCDCMIDENNIVYLVSLGNGNDSQSFRKVDIENETVSQMSIYGASCGFVDDDTFYMYRAGAWYTDPSYANGYAVSDGSSQWQGTYSTMDNYPVAFGGLCRDGYLYLPTLKDDKWQVGVYDGNSVPTFEPVPNPIRTYGNFGQKVTLKISGKNNFLMTYNAGRTKGAFATTAGIFYTDFLNRLSKISSNTDAPLCMSDKYIICTYGINKVIVYEA